MYIVNFTAHQQRNMVRSPHILGAGDATDVNIPILYKIHSFTGN